MRSAAHTPVPARFPVTPSAVLPVLFLALFLVCFCRPVLAQPGDASWLPPDLKPWQGWVLHGQESAVCPPLATDASRRQCRFPTRLALQVTATGAGFTATWRVFAPQSVPLPYAPGLWPVGVAVNGQPAAVLDASGVPEVRLAPGEYQVTGTLAWTRRPRTLRTPPETGLVELTVDGRPVPLPQLGPDGSLAIAPSGEGKAPEESSQVKVFRLISDGVPMTVTTLARLDVSGRVRTIVLDGLLPPGTEPMDVASPVPVGFGPDGRVLAQAGAGRYDIQVTSRFPGPVTGFGPATAPFGREIWAVAGAPQLRDLQAKGLPPIDPATTDLPEAWKNHPCFLADKGAVLTLAEIRRGESGPRGDDLRVRRTFWLDFDGKGFTVRDHLTGQLRRGWSLVMQAPGELGRAGLPGGDLPVVLIGKEGLRGVELRDAAVKLTAEARYPDPGGRIPASGWRAGVSSLSAVVNLPPGWRLFDASGPDSVSDSWVSQWNLLNIFLTLFLVVGAFKLRGAWAASALLAFLVTAQHELAAPVEAWLFPLAAIGLVRVTSRYGQSGAWERASKWARLLEWVTLAFLALSALPFVTIQITSAVHPQLGVVSMKVSGDAHFEEAPAPRPAKAPASAPRAGSMSPSVPGDALKMEIESMARERQALEQDPKSLVQTGPGLPTWNWNKVTLAWNGPVDASQSFSLTLICPAVTRLLCVARVAFLLAALWLLSGAGRIGFKSPGAAMGGSVAAAVLLLLPAATALAGPIPPQSMLDELHKRLVKPDDCFPDCAGVSEMAVSLDGKALRLTLTAGSATRLALPLPVVSDGWRPASVTVDGKPGSLFARDGGLWALLEPGAHTVIVTGPAPPGVSFSVSTPLAARLGRVDAPGYSVLGLGPDGALEGGLTFTRRDDTGGAGMPAMTAVIPPFLEVERVLTLGLEWEVATTVRRLTRTGEPVVAEVPLLAGESVLDRDIRVADGRAVAVLAAGQREVRWRSRLEVAPAVELAAPASTIWVETWRLEASPVWDVTLSGIPAVSSLDQAGRWSPLWRPWPGEKVVIGVTRPGPAPGESLTIDSATLLVIPGKRLDSASLALSLRSAMGGRHVLTLPGKCEITGMSIGGRPVPWSSDRPGEIGLAISPGRQDIAVSWREPRESLGRVTTPAVSVGHAATNVSVEVNIPHDRWILWSRGDTIMAPAILFWSSLCVTAVLAFALGFLPWTPLGRLQWLLLGLGLTQVDLGVALLAVAWLLALGLRRKYPPRGGWLRFDAVQIGLVLLTLAGLACLFAAIRAGLLGEPSMNITGNGSSAYHLAWYFDRTGEHLPCVEVFSLSIWWYRGLMLAWSLWMALSLFKWLRWGWGSFCEGGAWRGRPPRPPRPQGPSQTGGAGLAGVAGMPGAPDVPTARSGQADLSEWGGAGVQPGLGKDEPGSTGKD